MSGLKGDGLRPFGISIDYDETFSTCPETWTKVINVLRDAGARVFCVTARTPEMVISDFPGEVYYTSGRPKADFMHEECVDVHVWVDDMPQLIGTPKN